MTPTMPGRSSFSTKEETAGRIGFHVVSGDVDDAGGVSVEGACDGGGFFSFGRGDFDEFGAIGGECDGGLGDL